MSTVIVIKDLQRQPNQHLKCKLVIMSQRVPDISNDDLHRLIKRDFPESAVTHVLETLARYSGDSTKGRNRVHAAILKLSNGEVERIHEYIMVALNDYRDVIRQAEYPNYSEYAFAELDTNEKEGLIAADHEQYDQWFNS